ncbi:MULTISPECIES: hypothetical protein [Actinomycetes]|uniref:hypothetical protein n=1 Tax=Actinomycetes TaxID=1760 RepID=UPI0004BF593C|nr:MULTISPECIES: hypothetical protein [Actinomycetes]
MSSDRGSDRIKSPTVRFAVRAAIAGAVLGCAVGLGAYNNWLVSLLVGVPLVITALVISPRPRRIDGMLRAGQSRKQIPVTIEALTRSSLDASDVQPTLVTATISPPNDTDYRARWLTAMPKPVAATVLQDADTTLPSALIPPRPDTSLSYDIGIAPGKATEFGNHPPNSTLLQPLIIVLVAVALFVGVGDAWHISVSLPDAGLPSASEDSDPSYDPQKQVANLLSHIQTLGPGAENSILDLNITKDGYDNASVLDRATGQSLDISYSASSGKWTGPDPNPTDSRDPRTFRADDLEKMQFTVIRDQMNMSIPEESRQFQSMTVQRSDDNEPVLATAAFGEETENRVEIQANTEGVVATWFNPGDFQSSVTLAAEMMAEAGIPANEPIVNRFEIRGDPDSARISAGDIQNSGGVLVEYTDLKSSGSLSRAPGHFPSLRIYGDNKTGRLRTGSIAFTDVPASTFEQVRNDAMRRGNVDTFDRDLVDIEASYRYVLDDYQTVITIEVGPDPTEEIYSLDGQYIAPN